MKTNYFLTTCKELSAMKQRDLGGSHLFIRNSFDCLTIKRGNSGTAFVEGIEGDWSDIEIKAALHIYETTEASKR